MVGEAPRLTALLFALIALTGPCATAQPAQWLVDGSCRDGVPHGRYELRNGSGALRVAGAFSYGRRTGSFIFWTPAGARIAHIPYDDDARNGTLATWYETRRGDEPARRFESAWRRGTRDGLTRTWYPDGRRRVEAEYARGQVARVVAWNDVGELLDESAARVLADEDAAAADAAYEALETLVAQHPPRCE